MSPRVPPFTTRPEIEGSFGVVASTHWVASAVGMSMLERGGNAFDAGVATAFTLQIVEPHLNGPGGDTPILIHDRRARRTDVICGQGPAPAAASIDAFEELGLDLVPGTGLLAACIPGSFDAWMLLLRDYGTLRLSDVLAPAVYYAEHGVPVIPRIAAGIASVASLFREHWPSSAEVFLPHNAVPQVGQFFANPALAHTYARVLREAAGGRREQEIERARRIWSEGFIAEAIDRFCREERVFDVSGRHNPGLLTGQDMAGWQAHVEAPVSYDYGSYSVCKIGPWSQGPVLLQQLALLAEFELDGLDPCGPDFIHLQVEAAKLAFADREAFYGDPNFTSVPLEALLSRDYNTARRELIGNRASLDLRPGHVAGLGRHIPAVARAAAAVEGAGEPTLADLPAERGDTVHFDIIDRDGNMISATPSGGWLQSSPVIPGLGFPLGTRAQMFWLERDLPNSLAPGKRPRTTLTPSLALRDGEPWLAWGTPGGDQQDQWNLQYFLRIVHGRMNLQQAIDAPAWHSEHFPASFWPRQAEPGLLVVEENVPLATIEELRARGHVVRVGAVWSEGRLSAASREGRHLRAASSPRGMQGLAVGR
ncbi:MULTISPECIES: gamma-glutamyltransferase family protein [unclassified Chelatococcus]|uniref:gamma-glutamyltransferase family protein n=1 Tax=unclassified Chelatococcus TaxID=2638111 RepID=UPI001BCD5E61|nr:MULTISPECIES: gamma-glutamyltransferase family protein [unclassified Chelatococcus]MBS7699747.1 gamma-glutamyltransferase family protein [Chelatococcus sp. YT9]MBX3558093.1 gamma-glutamyltransferase family protein [Chelatococcus sp.]